MAEGAQAAAGEDAMGPAAATLSQPPPPAGGLTRARLAPHMKGMIRRAHFRIPGPVLR